MKLGNESKQAIEALALEKGVAVESMYEALVSAFRSAYMRIPGAAEEARVTLNPDSGEVLIYAQELDNEGNVIEEWNVELDEDEFGRIAAQSFKQMMTTKIRDAKQMTELKDWLNSINFTKQNLIEEDPDAISKYPPYIVNRCLSGHLDTVMFANEMNKFPNLDKDLQYHFFLNTLRKKKRFSPWLRKDKVTDLEIIKQYYGYSNEKALSALKILTPDQINFIKQRLDIGGIR